MSMTEELLIRAALRDELSQPLQKVRHEIAAVGREVRKLDAASKTSSRGLDAQGRSARGLGAEARKLDQRLLGLSRTLGRDLARGLRTVGIGLAATTAAVGFFGVKAASQFQQTRISLDGFLGSAEAGKRMFEDLQNLNLETPFQLQDVTKGSKMLLGFGFAGERILPIMKSVTDAAAGLGVGEEGLQRIILNLGQVQAAGVVTGRELRDFATLGFPGYELVASILGKTREEVRAMGDDAQVNSDQFIAAVENMSGPLQRFAGMAKAQMGSLAGQWANFQDVLNVRLADAANPLTESLTKMLPQLTEAVGTALDIIGPPIFGLLGELVSGLTPLIHLLGPVVGSLASGVGDVIGALVPALTAMQPEIPALTTAISQFFAALVPLAPSLTELLVALVPLATEFVEFLTSMTPMLGPFIQGLTWLARQKGPMAALLVTLLGYRALRGAALGISAFLGPLGGLTRQTTALGTAMANTQRQAGPGGVAGFFGSFKGQAAMMTGTTGATMFAQEAADPHKKPTLGGDAKLVAGAAMTGGAIGSMVPVVGTALGAGAGAAVGTGWVIGRRLFGGDTATSRQTIATHSAISAGVPGNRRVSNVFGAALGGPDHPAGRAVDVVGSNLQAYTRAVNAAGGYAALHGAGSGRHAHSVPPMGDTSSPRHTRRGSGPGDGSPTLLWTGNVVNPSSNVDVMRAVRLGFAQAERDRRERAAGGTRGRGRPTITTTTGG